MGLLARPQAFQGARISREALRGLLLQIAALPPEHREGLFVTESEAALLDCLCEHTPALAAEVAEWTGKSIGSVTGLLIRMERKGWVAVARKKAPRLWEITELGRKAARTPQPWARVR